MATATMERVRGATDVALTPEETTRIQDIESREFGDGKSKTDNKYRLPEKGEIRTTLASNGQTYVFRANERGKFVRVKNSTELLFGSFMEFKADKNAPVEKIKVQRAVIDTSMGSAALNTGDTMQSGGVAVDVFMKHFQEQRAAYRAQTLRNAAGDAPEEEPTGERETLSRMIADEKHTDTPIIRPRVISPAAPTMPPTVPPRNGGGGGNGRNGGSGNNGGNGGGNNNPPANNHNNHPHQRRNRLIVGITAGALAIGAIVGGVIAWDGSNKHKEDAEALDTINNMPQNIQTIDASQNYQANIDALTKLGVSNDDARDLVQGRIDYRDGKGAWWNPFDSVENPAEMRTALYENDQTKAIQDAIAEEKINAEISNQIADFDNDVKAKIATLKFDLNNLPDLSKLSAAELDAIINQTNAWSAQLEGITSSDDFKNNADEVKVGDEMQKVKDIFQAQIDAKIALLNTAKDALNLQKSANDLGVSVEDYQAYNGAATAMGLSIQDAKRLAEQFGVAASELGTPAAEQKMRDHMTGENNVNESYTATTPEEAKMQMLFAAYNNPAALAMYMGADSEDSADDGIDGLENPDIVNYLFQQYKSDPAKKGADFDVFKSALAGATIEIRDAQNIDGMSYGEFDGQLVAVASNQAGNGNTTITFVTFADGDKMVVKNICGQTWAGIYIPPAPEPIPTYTPEKPYTPPTYTPEKPFVPENPDTPDTPPPTTTITVAKDPTQNDAQAVAPGDTNENKDDAEANNKPNTSDNTEGLQDKEPEF